MLIKQLFAIPKRLLLQNNAKTSLLFCSKSTSKNYYSTSNLNNKVFLHDKYSSFTLSDVNKLSSRLSSDLLASLNRQDLNGEKIAVLCANNYTYLISVLAIWMANGVPLGLNKQYPNSLIEYFINDSKCKLVINGLDDETAKKEDQSFNSLLSKYSVVNYKLNESTFHSQSSSTSNENEDAFKKFRNLLDLDEVKNKEGIILYTSGTSGPPKGVVLTRANLARTMQTIIDAWHMTSKDSCLHSLPLNHVHGLTYLLLTYLYAGAEVHMLPKFSPEQVWDKLLSKENNINSFMAVPTIYVQLVNAMLSNRELRQKYSSEHVKWIFKNKMRLIVSGSAPLNVKTHREWNEITGYNILERYGMTEIGLGLTNPLVETPSFKRTAGAVGRPYGNQKVRIVEPNSDGLDENHVLVESDLKTDTFYNKAESKSIFGELQVKGDMVFREYLNKPVQTKETFSNDGWFKTGDTAEFLKDLKVYKLVGRTSVDVIKSGGYKISALDVEKVVLSHEAVDDVSVMGLSDPVWGQRVFALLVLKSGKAESFKQDEFKKWCKLNLPKYSVPTLVKVIDKMPRNLLGKVNKKELIKVYEKEFNTSS